MLHLFWECANRHETLKQRRFNVATLNRRCFDVVLPLGCFHCSQGSFLKESISIQWAFCVSYVAVLFFCLFWPDHPVGGFEVPKPTVPHPFRKQERGPVLRTWETIDIWSSELYPLLKETHKIGRFSATFTREASCLLSCKSIPFWKGSILKEKNLLQRGANSFLLK